jgi:hypothetical protein
MKAILCIGSLVGLLGTIAVACTSATPPPPPDDSVAAFCSDWANAYCQLSSICQFDVPTCETFQTGACNAFATSAQASGNRTYSQPAGNTCINLLNSSFANGPSTLSAAALGTINDTCNLAFVGNQVVDKSCASDYDCLSPNVCGSVPGQTGGLCGPESAKVLGDPCADPGDDCQGDTYCALVSGGVPACATTPAIGAQCSATIPCGTGAYCASNGICTASAGVGQTCTATTDCAAGLYCDTYPPAVCVTELTFARGATDCNGILGTDEPGNPTPAEAGVTPVSEDAGSDTGAPDTGAADAAAD